MNIITPGATFNPDATQRTYNFVGGPLHGSKLPVHPRVVKMMEEVGLNVGGKMQVYSPVNKMDSAGHPTRIYVYSKE